MAPENTSTADRARWDKRIGVYIVRAGRSGRRPMRSQLQAACVAGLLALAPTARAGTPTFVETFDGGSNTGGWTYGGPGSIPASGGNPGAYLNSGSIDTFAPQLRTTLV